MSIHPALTGAEAAAAAGLDPNFVPCKSLLSDKAILAHMAKGTVLIEPFDMENLSTSRSDRRTRTGRRSRCCDRMARPRSDPSSTVPSVLVHSNSFQNSVAAPSLAAMSLVGSTVTT